MRFPPAFQVHAQTLHLLPLSALRPKCFPTNRVLAIKIRPGVLTDLAPKFSLSVSNGDIFGKASYNRDKFILLVTIFFQKKWWKNKCLTKPNLHWKLLTDAEVLVPMPCFRDLSELWSRLRCRCYSVRKQLQDFTRMSLWTPIPCHFSQVFFCFFLFLLFWKTKLPNINLRSFHWRSA